MINYSIVMRSVNANLLEINQAKSRINQAKKDGKEPDKKDTDLVKTEKQNAFAISQTTGTEGSETQGAGDSGTTGDQGTSGGNTGGEDGGDDFVNL